MSFVISNKHRIHYRLSGEKGPWLILHPPFILDHECWDMSGFVQLLERDFRLMLIDPLGHGRSDAPEDPTCYSMESRAQDVLNVMQEVQMDFAHFFGVGLGGQVGFQMAVDAQRKIRSLITAAAHPYPRLDEIKPWKKVWSNSDQETFKTICSNGEAKSIFLWNSRKTSLKAILSPRQSGWKPAAVGKGWPINLNRSTSLHCFLPVPRNQVFFRSVKQAAA